MRARRNWLAPAQLDHQASLFVSSRRCCGFGERARMCEAAEQQRLLSLDSALLAPIS